MHVNTYPHQLPRVSLV